MLLAQGENFAKHRGQWLKVAGGDKARFPLLLFLSLSTSFAVYLGEQSLHVHVHRIVYLHVWRP